MKKAVGARQAPTAFLFCRLFELGLILKSSFVLLYIIYFMGTDWYEQAAKLADTADAVDVPAEAL